MARRGLLWLFFTRWDSADVPFAGRLKGCRDWLEAMPESSHSSWIGQTTKTVHTDGPEDGSLMCPERRIRFCCLLAANRPHLDGPELGTTDDGGHVHGRYAVCGGWEIR